MPGRPVGVAGGAFVAAWVQAGSGTRVSVLPFGGLGEGWTPSPGFATPAGSVQPHCSAHCLWPGAAGTCVAGALGPNAEVVPLAGQTHADTAAQSSVFLLFFF